ncbi:MAG: hypothetical protein SCK28_13485 [Bacillota bacterium]|nr:hypothetical protein [Bacillota bacterium]
MNYSNLKTTYIISIATAVLALVAAGGGLLLDNLYLDNNDFILIGWYANDMVTLLVALPLLAASIIFSIKGSYRAQLLLLGILNYMFYNYAFYLFGAALNMFFLIYAALLVLPVFGLIFGLLNLDMDKIGDSFSDRTPVRLISSFMIFLALMLGIAWTGQWLNFVINGQLPQIMVDVGATNNIVAALDLTLVVPFFTLAAIWLWQRKAIGYVLAIIVLVKGFIYNVVLTVGSIIQANSGIAGAADLVPLWVFLGAGCLISVLLLIVNLKRASS